MQVTRLCAVAGVSIGNKLCDGRPEELVYDCCTGALLLLLNMLLGSIHVLLTALCLCTAVTKLVTLLAQLCIAWLRFDMPSWH